jgi:hypothetical protein
MLSAYSVEKLPANIDNHACIKYNYPIDLYRISHHDGSSIG